MAENINLPVQRGAHGKVSFPLNSITGSDECPLLVREFDKSGAVVLANAKVRLSEGDGLTAIGYGDNKSWMVDSTGIYRMNQIAGLSVVSPDPILERDANGFVERVTMRKLAIGLSPLGNLVATDTTLVLSARAYFLEALAKCVAKYPQAGTVGTADERPKSWKHQPTTWSRSERKRVNDGPPEIIEAPDTIRYWAGPMDMGVWADITHPEVQSLMNNAIQGERFFIRKAETIADRRVLSKHPAINRRKVTDKEMRGDTAEVNVVFRHNPLDRDQQEELGRRLLAGERVSQFKGLDVEIEQEELTEAEVIEEATTDTAEEVASDE